MASAECRWSSPEDWSQWSEWLGAGLHARNRWRLPVLLLGMLLANGRRTVTTWLRAAGVSDDYQDYYYFLTSLGRNGKTAATRLVVLVVRVLPLPERVAVVIDDSPTRRYGRHVEGADFHRHPSPGPANQPFLYGHIWVTIALAVRHPQWGAIGLPLRAMLYVRRQTQASIPKRRRWHRFATKLQLAARLVEWLAPLLKKAGKTVWVVVDGGYTKAPFLKRVLRLPQVVIVGRLRKDAALYDLPTPPRRGARRSRGRPRKYGERRISLAKRGGQRRGWDTVKCTAYGAAATKRYKTFLATYRPVGGAIRIVLIQEKHGWYAFYCTDLTASVQEIVEAFADRATIEQDFHDVKEVWGAGQQQVRSIWNNLAAYNLNLCMHTLVELWAWNRAADSLADRTDSPWDDPERRPSHANRRKALRAQVMRSELLTLAKTWTLPQKFVQLADRLVALAA
jgi:phenylpyruvate tautomerase PptA (4-oxalocrotonate tautomerase family)